MEFVGMVDLIFVKGLKPLSNEYVIAAIGFDTSENGPLKVWDRKRVSR